MDGRERETESVKRKADKKIHGWTKGERRGFCQELWAVMVVWYKTRMQKMALQFTDCEKNH